MLESLDQAQILVHLEQRLELLSQRLELVHVTLFDTGDDLEVGSERLHELFLRENRSFRDLTHEEFNDDEQFLDLDAEAESADLGGLTQGLDQVGLSG